MSETLNKIVILGGGGNIGAVVLRGLLKAPDLHITALKRIGSKSSFPTAPNLKVVESDFTHASLVSLFRDNDTVISVVGKDGINEQKPFVDAAVEAGIKRFLPSEFGVNGQSKTVQEMTPFFAAKQELLDYLVEKEKDGLTWTGLIVGALLDWCLSNGFIGFDLSTKRATIWDDGNAIFSGVNEEELGKAVVGVLKHPAETANKFVYVSSLAVSQSEILAALEKATSSKWDVTRVSTQEQLETARVQLSQGNFAGAFTIVKATILANVPGLKKHFEVDEQDRLQNKLLGVPEVDLQKTVDSVLAGGQYNGFAY
jgi:nucleoside-diphosphate-sugar epimerase